MTDRLAVTLTTDELAALIQVAVGRVLSERAGTDARTHVTDEMTVGDVVALFRLAPKSGPKTIWRWRRKLGFPAPHRRGNRARYLRAEVDAWRAEQGTSGAGAVTPPTRGRREARGATAPH